MSDLENPEQPNPEQPNPEQPDEYLNCSDGTFEKIGSMCRLLTFFTLVLWVFLAGYFYYLDKFDNIIETEATITSTSAEDNIFKEYEHYNIYYQFTPKNEDHHIKGFFREYFNTEEEIAKANLHWKPNEEIIVYYREDNPKKNDINRYTLVDGGHIANIFISSIFLAFCGTTCLIFAFIKLDHRECRCRYRPIAICCC